VTETEVKPPLDFPELESGDIRASADEFAHVPSPRRRHPAVALGAAGLALFLLYQIHEDVIYAISSSAARDLGDARGVAATPIGQLPINRYVRMSGMVDRESGVIIDTAGSWRLAQFFRVLGTQSRVFVSRVPDPLPVEQAERDVFTGRLVRFRDLSFQGAIRKHFGRHVTATHFFAPAALHEQVARAGSGSLVTSDMLGEKVSLAASDEIAIDVARPSDVQVDLPRAKVADVAAARALIERQGGTVLDEAVKPSDGKSIAVVVTFPPEKRDQAMSTLADLDERVRFRPVRRTYKVRIADVGAAGNGWIVNSGGESKSLAMAQILAIRTLANVQIPDDAILLREGEPPRGQLKTVVVAAFLLAFAFINLLGLRARG